MDLPVGFVVRVDVHTLYAISRSSYEHNAYTLPMNARTKRIMVADVLIY